MQDKLDKEQIARQMEETRQFLLNFKDRRGELNTLDELERKLIAEENDKQQQKREAVWRAEEEARIKLMYQVYAARDKKILGKKSLKKDSLTQKQQERQYEIDMLENYEKEVEIKKKKIAEINKQHQ